MNEWMVQTCKAIKVLHACNHVSYIRSWLLAHFVILCDIVLFSSSPSHSSSLSPPLLLHHLLLLRHHHLLLLLHEIKSHIHIQKDFLRQNLHHRHLQWQFWLMQIFLTKYNQLGTWYRLHDRVYRRSSYVDKYVSPRDHDQRLWK